MIFLRCSWGLNRTRTAFSNPRQICCFLNNAVSMTSKTPLNIKRNTLFSCSHLSDTGIQKYNWRTMLREVWALKSSVYLGLVRGANIKSIGSPLKADKQETLTDYCLPDKELQRLQWFYLGKMLHQMFPHRNLWQNPSFLMLEHPHQSVWLEKTTCSTYYQTRSYVQHKMISQEPTNIQRMLSLSYFNINSECPVFYNKEFEELGRLAKKPNRHQCRHENKEKKCKYKEHYSKFGLFIWVVWRFC